MRFKKLYSPGQAHHVCSIPLWRDIEVTEGVQQLRQHVLEVTPRGLHFTRGYVLQRCQLQAQ